MTASALSHSGVLRADENWLHAFEGLTTYSTLVEDLEIKRLYQTRLEAPVSGNWCLISTTLTRRIVES